MQQQLPDEPAYRNVSAGRAVWHSSAANFDNTAHLLTSGLSGPLADSIDNVWISFSNRGEWVYIDLGASTELAGVTVSWGKNYALRYRIQAAPDAVHWETLANATGRANSEVETSLAGVTARFVRIFCEESSGDNYIIKAIVIRGRNDLEYHPSPLPEPEADGTQRLTGGNWKLQRASEVHSDGAALSQAGYDDSPWLPATVPGSILVSYLKAGAIPDPNYDDWQFQVSDAFFTADFWYRDSFEIPASRQGQRIFLNFDAINWKADIFFNGHFLPNALPNRTKSIEGAFIRGKFDITQYAKQGEPNYLAVRIFRNDTPGKVSTQGLAEGPLPNGGPLGADNPTMHAAIGWDWLPTIRGRDIGILEDVYLSYSGDVEILDPWMETRLAVTEKSSGLSVADLALDTAVVIRSEQDYSHEELKALVDENASTQWIGRDIDGAGFTIDFGKPTTAGSVTIAWGTEAGGRAADLESRYPAQFRLESSVDGEHWLNFDAFPGGDVDGKWFGMLSLDPRDGTPVYEGHATSDSVQGPTGFKEMDFTAFNWGIITVPFFMPQQVRYLRFTSVKRRMVNGALVPTRIQHFRIYAESPQQVEQSLVRTYSLDTSKADLSFRTEIKNSSDSPVTAVLSGLIMPGGIRFEKNLEMPAKAVENVEISGIVINKPELWWPNTYGDQFLYTAEARVSVNGIQSDAKQFKFGVRQFAYPVDGDMLTLFCNGVRIVVKGGSWGIDDGLKLDTPEVYDNKARLHAEANFTMIRNWVGMTNHRAFYDACDKYGILIWNDFWLANPQDGPDPNDPAMFLENAIDKIKRVRSHAAMALYCGRNESKPPEPLNAGLMEKTASYDGTRFYFPNSAGPPVGSGGGYSLPVPGGEHGIKQYFNDVSSTVIRSERGIPNIPIIESLQKFVKPENLWPISEVWALHDWTYHMNGPASTYMSTLKCYIDGNFEVPVDTVKDGNPKADDPEFQAYKKKVMRMVQDAGSAYTLNDFNRMAQMINYENHRGLFEALTARRSNGLLMWMSQSSWPSFMWQTYDWFLDVNGGYFGVKAGNQPVNAVFDPRNNTILLSNTTAHAYTSISTTLTLFDLPGNVVSSRDYVTDQLEPDSYGIVLATVDFSASPSDLVFIKLIVKDASGKALADNLYWHNRKVYQDYRALNSLPAVDLSASVSALPPTACGNSLYAITLKNSAAAPAVQTRIRTISGGKDVLPTFYSDNYFALMPRESKTISVEFDPQRLADGAPCFVLSGWNTAVKTIRSPC